MKNDASYAQLPGHIREQLEGIQRPPEGYCGCLVYDLGICREILTGSRKDLPFYIKEQLARLPRQELSS